MKRIQLAAVVALTLLAFTSSLARAEVEAINVGPIANNQTLVVGPWTNVKTWLPNYKIFYFRGNVTNPGASLTLTVTFRNEDNASIVGTVSVVIPPGTHYISTGPVRLSPCPAAVGLAFTPVGGPVTSITGDFEHLCHYGTAVPTMGTWGLIVLALLLLSAPVYFLRRRQNLAA